MSDWVPVAILPNLSGGEPVEGEVIALVSSNDQRLRAICAAKPKIADLLSRFTDAFGTRLSPVVLIARSDAVGKLSADALLSFRDLAAISIIPYSRSMNVVYRSTNRIVYSNSFWLYPWMIGTDDQTFTASTPAFSGFHEVSLFHGQSSPELPIMQIEEIDTPLLEALLVCWKRHYLSKRRLWKDRALFRSLNMAVQAAALPAGVGTTVFDLGRSVALWVSAFEILSHPRTHWAGVATVYPLLEAVTYCDRNVGRRRYAAPVTKGKKNKGSKEPRRALPCWVYSQLNQARNHFLHGNPIPKAALSPKGSKDGLFWLAPSLYRLALTGFLKISVDRLLPYRFADGVLSDPKMRKRFRAVDCQEIAERALLRIRKSPDAANRARSSGKRTTVNNAQP